MYGAAKSGPFAYPGISNATGVAGMNGSVTLARQPTELLGALSGVSYSTRSAKGNRYLRRVLCQIAWAAVHSKGAFFAQLFNRLKPKIEAKGAVWAVAHRIARVIWLILTRGVEYIEKGPTPPNQRTMLRKLRRLARDFALLGIDFNKAASLAAA